MSYAFFIYASVIASGIVVTVTASGIVVTVTVPVPQS
jgi:hypothetical protein